MNKLLINSCTSFVNGAGNSSCLCRHSFRSEMTTKLRISLTVRYWRTFSPCKALTSVVHESRLVRTFEFSSDLAIDKIVWKWSRLIAHTAEGFKNKQVNLTNLQLWDGEFYHLLRPFVHGNVRWASLPKEDGCVVNVAWWQNDCIPKIEPDAN